MDTLVDTLEYSPGDASPRRSAPVRFLFRNNPFYLLSAMCMLGGCLALTNSLSWTSIGLGRLLALVVTLNLYEGLLLALGLYLLARRNIVRDGLMLLFLEALFLVDAAFLNVEVFAVDFHVGLAVNLLVLLLAAVKLLVLFRAMRLPLDGTFVVVLTQLVVLFGTPGLFAYVTRGGNGALPAGLAYGAWWTPGIIAALAALLLRGPRLRELLGAPAPGHEWVQAVVRRSFVWLPMVSLLAHLVMAQWVYNAHLYAAYLAPLLLGLAVMLGTAGHSPRPFSLAARRVILPALAVVLSFDAPESLRLAVPWSRVALTPLVAAAGAAYVLYVFLFLPRYALRLIGGATAAVVALAVGPTPGQVVAASQQGSQWVVSAVARAVVRVLPKTSTGWGVTAVGAAFAFLGVGAAISLRKPPQLKDEG